MNRERKRYCAQCEVSAVKIFNLGGFPQKVAIEGRRKNLPVVVCLHGGPGSPVPFSVGCRGLFPEWTDRAIMVYWDQLGCGANHYQIDDGFTVDRFVKMTCDLIAALKAEYPENKLYLFGISWGSVLALKAAASASLADGALVYGQVIKNLLFNEQVFAALASVPAQKAMRIAEIKRAGVDCADKVLDENLRDLTGFIRKYTQGYVNRAAKPMAVGGIVKGLLTSPDYKLRDVKAIVKNGYRGNVSLWRELLGINLTKELAAVRVPYRILQGDTDIVTPTEIARGAVEEADNAFVTLDVVPDAGHIPSAAAVAKIFGALCGLIGAEKDR